MTWPGANPQPTVCEADMLTTKPSQRGLRHGNKAQHILSISKITEIVLNAKHISYEQLIIHVLKASMVDIDNHD